MEALRKRINDFVNLFYPNVCACCGKNLLHNEYLICNHCLYKLPKTNYHQERNNPLEQIFWGKVKIESAAAFFFYNKGSKYQRLIHQMKYNGLKDLGYELGKMYGSDLISSVFSSVDVIVPVPLHPKKERRRGYNQSDWIAEGIAKTMRKPIERHNLCRVKANETQTRKSRIERWENVQDIFIVKNVNFFTNKHVLLIDDVITTGATLEACTAQILQCENTRVSIATLAVA